MASEPISTAYLINLPPNHSVCLYVLYVPLSLLGKGSARCILHFIARQRLGKHVPAAANTRNKEELFDACLLSLCIPLSFLGNNSVKTFPRQRRIVGGVVFYAVRLASKESMRVVLPRTSCFLYFVKYSSFQELF
jgi:hypothetical protein